MSCPGFDFGDSVGQWFCATTKSPLADAAAPRRSRRLPLRIEGCIGPLGSQMLAQGVCLFKLAAQYQRVGVEQVEPNHLMGGQGSPDCSPNAGLYGSCAASGLPRSPKAIHLATSHDRGGETGEHVDVHGCGRLDSFCGPPRHRKLRHAVLLSVAAPLAVQLP